MEIANIFELKINNQRKIYEKFIIVFCLLMSMGTQASAYRFKGIISKGDLQALMKLSDEGLFLVNGYDCTGKTALYWAAYYGQKRIARWLLQNSANCNKTSMTGEILPLHVAAENGYADIVKLLIDAGSNIHAKRGRDESQPLYLAARNGHTGVVVQLLKSRASVHEKRRLDGFNPLHAAAENGHAGVVKQLLNGGADVRAKTKDGFEALHMAARNGHAGTVEQILNGGADVRANTKDGFEALHMAAGNGHAGTVEQLLNGGADVRARTEDGFEALHMAAGNGHTSAVEQLLNGGADVNACNHKGTSALCIASRMHGDDKIVNLLLFYGANSFFVRRDYAGNGLRPYRAAIDEQGKLDLGYFDASMLGGYEKFQGGSFDEFKSMMLGPVWIQQASRKVLEVMERKPFMFKGDEEREIKAEKMKIVAQILMNRQVEFFWKRMRPYCQAEVCAALSRGYNDLLASHELFRTLVVGFINLQHDSKTSELLKESEEELVINRMTQDGNQYFERRRQLVIARMNSQGRLANSARNIVGAKEPTGCCVVM